MTASERFAQERDALVGGDLRGLEFSGAYGAAVDRWLEDLLGDRSGMALVALGSYGRGELAPASDIDVLLVHRGRSAVGAVAERVWYPMWDAGVKVGHGVRTLREALALAGHELDVATSLLDARFVAGDAELVDELSSSARAQWRKRASSWLPALAGSVAERHSQAGEVAFLLEPDVKSGRGGLRDVHALRWLDIAEPGLYDTATVTGAHDVLHAVRVSLHRVTAKARDVLWLEDQDAVARVEGDVDADKLMARVASAARTIAWTSDDVWSDAGRPPAARRARHVSRDRELGDGLVLREGLVELAADADPAGDPALALRAAAAAARRGARIGPSTLNRFVSDLRSMPEPWPDEARTALVDLLATGHAAIPVLESLDHRGLLVRLLPEWESVRSRPQRNAYHRFTVDRHLCETAAEAALRTDRVARPDLLLVGAWLHDIGKGAVSSDGSGPDHTSSGIDLVHRIATRLGFLPADVAVLENLVRHHLLLPDVATRRDLGDPATVANVADAVGDVDTLKLLHALTEADSIATGPSAWSPWKSTLVGALVDRTTTYLTGAPSETAADDREEVLLAALVAQARAADALVVERHDRGVAVVAPDRPGLFSRVAGTLTLHRLNVLEARAWATTDGFAVESFQLQPEFAEEPDWAALREDLVRALDGRLALDARLTDRARTYATGRQLAATPARRAVTVDNEASASSTVVEVRAPDRPGVLYRVTRAMADLDLDVRHAKVATLGHEVVDAFYVVDRAGRKLAAEHAGELERAILVELDRV